MCETRYRLINEVIFLLMIIMLIFAVFKPRVIIFKTVRHFSACILPEICTSIQSFVVRYDFFSRRAMFEYRRRELVRGFTEKSENDCNSRKGVLYFEVRYLECVITLVQGKFYRRNKCMWFYCKNSVNVQKGRGRYTGQVY